MDSPTPSPGSSMVAPRIMPILAKVIPQITPEAQRWVVEMIDGLLALRRESPDKPTKVPKLEPTPSKQPVPEKPKKWYTPAKVAGIIGVHYETLMEKMRNGTFPFVQVGRRRMVPPEMLEKWRQDHSIDAPPPQLTIKRRRRCTDP